jgi:bifunctional non-homologous end joining protein LigD
MPKRASRWSRKTALRATGLRATSIHGWTHGGRVRHSSFQYLREDKPAKEVVHEVKAMAAVNINTSAKHRSAPARARETKTKVGDITLSHPDRVYWKDTGVTKRDLAVFYTQVWKWMRPHVTGRPISLLRCPGGVAGQCFPKKRPFQGSAPWAGA